MPEYVEREVAENAALEADYDDSHFRGYESDSDYFYAGQTAARESIARLPAADVAPVVHAQWIENPQTSDYTCSLCGRVCADDHIECPYCHCGARMDGGEHHAD